MDNQNKTIYGAGDEVRIIKSGRVVVLEDINDNPDYLEQDECWAEARSVGNDSSVAIDSPDDVRLVRHAKDIPIKRLPTLKELGSCVSGAMHSTFGEEISFSETDTGGQPEGHVLAYGISATGQPFSCRIVVSEIDWADF